MMPLQTKRSGVRLLGKWPAGLLLECQTTLRKSGEIHGNEKLDNGACFRYVRLGMH